MAGSATITGTQNYIMGIGHPKTEATTEAPPAVFSTDPLTGGVVGIAGASSATALPFLGSLSTASSAAIATANTAMIQAALTAGGLVQVLAAGIYELNAPLVIPSNTFLQLGPNVTLRQRASTFKNMLQTAAFVATPAAITLSWSSGTTVTVTKTAHGKSVGDYVVIDNGSTASNLQSRFKGTWRIASVTDANNYTYNTILLPTTAPTGSWTVVDATVNSGTAGGTWDYNATNNPNGSSDTTPLAHYWYGTANCNIRPGRFYDLLKYGVCINADSGSTVADVVCDSINSSGGDVIKVYGPSYGTQVSNIRGRTGDDMVSVQTKEPAAFIFYQKSYGDCIGVKVQNVYGGKNASATSGVILYCSPNETHKGCEIDGVHGTFAGQAVRIQPGDTFAGVLFSAKVKNVTASGTNSLIIGGGGGGATLRYGSITVEDIDHNPPTLAGGDCINVGSLTTGNLLNFIGIRSEVDSLSTPVWPTGSAAIVLNIGGTATVVNIEKCDMSGVAGNARFSQFGAASVIGQINLSKSNLLGQRGIYLVTGAAAPLVVVNEVSADLQRLVDCEVATQVVFRGVTLRNATIGGYGATGASTLLYSGVKILGTAVISANGAGTMTPTVG